MKKLRTFVLALLLILTLITPSRAWGATPGIEMYNAHVASLYGQGCTYLMTIKWSDSLWGCPVRQLWRLTLDEATDTVTLVRLVRGR